MNEESLFAAALEKTTPADRRAFLDQACAGDAALRQRVEQLLAADGGGAGILERGPEAVGLADAPPGPPLAAGHPFADRFRLRKKLGEGGMGEVWEADQTEPVQRLIALKVVRPGHDTARLLARFEQEQQALALMDHPNIAKVLDAGVADGRPYFVMELIRGVPVTEYCDAARLSPRERLELFIPVCQAVQHAHQKGVIHRDLKPSNILVGLYDGRPVPKVIDFGVAKATGPRLTEQSFHTEEGWLIGTPEYMSPEQATLNNQDIDTRSDVYSLGAVLYELLTGSEPFTRREMRAASFADMLRLIKDVDPPKPSTKLSASETLASVAAVRQTEPKKLVALVRGELDWIVMKCLEKDRARRYETANGLAMDLQRYLADDAVVAGPPSAGYRLRKFVRRNRGPVLVVSLLVLALAGGIVGTGIGLVRADQARRAERERAEGERRAKETAEAKDAETQAVLDFVQSRILAAARPEGQKGGLGREVTLRKALEAALPAVDTSFAQQPLTEARLCMTLGESFYYLDDAQTAADQFQKARTLYTEHRGPDHPDTLSSMNSLANSYLALARHQDARKLYEETLALRKAKLGPDHPDTLGSMNNLGACYSVLGRHQDALKLDEEVLALRKVRLGPDHPDTLGSMNNLANSYLVFGRYANAFQLQKEVLALLRAKLGPDHPDTLDGMNNLAYAHAMLGQHADAVQLLEETLALRKAKQGPHHRQTLATMMNLANVYSDLGRHADALKLREETLALEKAHLPPNHPDTLWSMHNLANSYSKLERHAEALKLREETLALREANLGPTHPDTLRSLRALAESLVQFDRGAEAVQVIDDCVRRSAGKVVHPKLIPGVMDLRLRHFAKAKDAAGCRATAEMWEKLQRIDADSLYFATRYRAVTAAVLRAADTFPAAAQEADAEADRALAWLQKAVAAGYKDVANLKKDPDLDALRGRADFQALVAGLAGR